MAPDPESVYFPLEKCLNGDYFILPWKTVYYAITDEAFDHSDPELPLRSFLANNEVKSLLSAPLDVFLPPSAQTKSSFEQKTSAINVTPSANSRYDLKQIKEDALWLSEAVSVDQVSALRVAVVECQDRAAARLLSPFTEDELAGIREAAGNTKYSTTLPLSILSQAADPEDVKKEFESENARRKRLLDTYLVERSSFLAAFNIVIQAARLFQARENEISSESLKEPTWLEALGLELVKDFGKSNVFLSHSVEVIQKTIEDFEKGCGGFTDNATKEEIDIPWGRGLLAQVVHTAESIFDLVVSNPEATSSKNLLDWFRLVTNHKYFSTLETADSTIQALHATLQSLVATISLAMLKLAHTIDFLSDSSSPLELVEKPPGNEQYFLNKATIYQIQALFQNTAEEMDPVSIAGPAMLGWTAFLSFLRARVIDFQESIQENGSQQPVEYGDVLEQILNKDVEDSIDIMGLKAVNECKVFEVITALAQRLGTTIYAPHTSLTSVRMRLVLLDLIQHTTVIGYVPEVVEALLSVLCAGENYWDHVDADRIPASLNPVLAFFSQVDLVNTFLRNAASRYPLESAPFLQLVRGLASLPSTYRDATNHALLEFMNEVPVFTYQLPEDFRGYETVHEEENTNSIQLRHPVELFSSRTKTLYRSSTQALVIVDSDFTIHAGTQGRIVSDSGPRVALWFHKYSALKYFGKLLETYLTASNVIDAITGEAVERECVSDIIEILAALLFGLSQETSTSRGATEDATRVLELASAGLNRNRDIITVIFDIFEEELQRVSNMAGAEVSLDVLISCIHFMHALLPVYPRRVWPLLSQSKLIDTGRGGGRLGTIVEAVELVSGNYDFLISCALLYQAAVDELVLNVVRRRGSSKSSARYTEVNDCETGVSDQILSRTMLLFTKYFVDALESSSAWKFTDQRNRKQLLAITSTTFQTILDYTFGLVNDAAEGAQHLLGSLSPAASVIVDSFLSTSAAALRFQSFLKAYYDAFDGPPNTSFRSASRVWISYVQSMLILTSTLLRVCPRLNRGTTQFETQIFRCVPLIARLISVHQAFQPPTLKVFESLVLAATHHDSEPPSLLAHLGSFTSRNFIQVLCHIDKPLNRPECMSQTSNFLSVVVSSRQQWFSNYLLTGKTPKAALQKVDSEPNAQGLERPFLTIVLEKLSLIKSLSQSETLNSLKFMALAQNFWPWTVYSSDKYEKYIKALLEFIGELKPIQQNKDPLDAIYQTRIAAYIGEIITMHIFHSRQTGSTIDFNTVEENLEYFGRFAAEVPGYNPSLHSNLKKNFSKRYNGVQIQAFQGTDLEDRELGKNYYYDQRISEKLLSYDAGWNGKQNNGMRNEVALANFNLSLVDAQIALFQSWKVLSIELSNRLSTSEKLPGLLTSVANKCLISNSRPQPSEEIFVSLSQTRAELALVLAQRLVQTKCKDPALKQLMNYAWDNIKSLRGSFERGLVGSEVTYYRTLLKLLYLALQVYAPRTDKQEDLRASVIDSASSSLIPTLLDILKYVVAAGVRELASSLHSASSVDDSTSTPEDLSILTGILQTILHIPQIELHSASLVNIFGSASTARIATTLYSWSDTLAVNGDPIYGELSLLFLLELSSIQPMAEQMAIEGVLGQIASANITNHLRSGNVGAFVDSIGAQRCYGVWVRGILPFCLNLLDAVQIPIASEISLFLSQFAHLLAQSSQALESPETNRLLSKGQSKFITLTSCAEIHSLALISHILNLYKKEIGGEGIVDLEWDGAAVGENADWWLGSRDVLRQRIVPMGEREVELSRRKKDGSGDVSLLEVKVVAELEGARSVLNSRY